MPLGIDATLRYALHNWTQPLKVSELQRDTPYNTRTRRACRRRRSATPAWPRSRPPRTRRQAVPVLRRQAVRQRRATPSPRPRRSSSPTSRPTTQPAQPTAARARRTASGRRAWACSAGRCATAARPRCSAPRCARSGSTAGPTSCCRCRRSCSTRPSARCRRAGFAGANVTIPHKEAALAVADSADAAARAIGAANTLDVHPDGGSRADNTDAPGLLAALPRTPPASRAGARRGRQRAGGGLRARGRRRARCRSGTGRPSRAEGLRRRPVRRARRSSAGRLLVNCTPVGLARPPVQELPLDPAELDELVVVDLVYRDGRHRLLSAPRPGPRGGRPGDPGPAGRAP